MRGKCSGYSPAYFARLLRALAETVEGKSHRVATFFVHALSMTRLVFRRQLLLRVFAPTGQDWNADSPGNLPQVAQKLVRGLLVVCAWETPRGGFFLAAKLALLASS